MNTQDWVNELFWLRILSTLTLKWRLMQIWWLPNESFILKYNFDKLMGMGKIFQATLSAPNGIYIRVRQRFKFQTGYSNQSIHTTLATTDQNGAYFFIYFTKMISWADKNVVKNCSSREIQLLFDTEKWFWKSEVCYLWLLCR